MNNFQEWTLNIAAAFVISTGLALLFLLCAAIIAWSPPTWEMIRWSVALDVFASVFFGSKHWVEQD